MKNNNLFLALGQIALVIGISCLMFNTFVFNNIPALSFVCGALFGLSLVLNLTYMMRRGRSKKMNIDD